MSDPLANTPKALVFSDLDGTLLDHHNYSFDPAKASLAKLKAAHIPVILNTSKTSAEVKVIHQQLELTAPFIIENGAAIFIPKDTFDKKPKGAIWHDGYWVKAFASRRSHWLTLVNKLQAEFEGQFEGFSQMSIARIQEVTGLSEENAVLASKRLYGEPLLWTGTEQQKNDFICEISKLGAYPLLGGRFLHICGDTNKGKALTWLRDEYERQWQVNGLKTVALGDGNNDIAMLEVADIAVRVLSPVNPPPTLQREDAVYTSRSVGPEGWQEIIERIFPELH